MAETTIEWTRGPNGEPGFTFNPWIGCTKVSPGCDHCYAARQEAHRKWTPEGWGGPRRRTSASNWQQPRKWNAQAEREGRRFRVFCASLADVFDNEVPDLWRDELMGLIVETPNLDWLLLTKRIGNVAKMLKHNAWQHLPNVWLGATVVNQEEADRDIPKLLAVPARVRFLSIEPMLGPIDLFWPETLWPDGPRRCCSGHECGCMGQPIDPWLMHGINWVIAGGESGPRARPAHPDWFRSLRDQCQAAGLPFLHKQNGEWAPPEAIDDDGTKKLPEVWMRRDGSTGGGFFEPGVSVLYRAGKKAAGRLLDGVEHNGFPEVR